ncbi:hypothetical protein HK405_003532 [Cladochytrium tenue]|nr:hypothetical protein HK405_003532 [Cladochytrium tenue]
MPSKSKKSKASLKTQSPAPANGGGDAPTAKEAAAAVVASAAAASEAVPAPTSSSAAATAAAAAAAEAAPAPARPAGAGKVKRALLLDEQDRLTAATQAALLEVFGRFDDDGDGALSRSELEAFAIATNGEKFEEDAVDELKKSFHVDKNENLTKRGFLEMYQRDLIKHGYSVKLQLVRRVTGNADPEWAVKKAQYAKGKGNA